jgi:ribosome-binding protein aMBF1 (putative translation factor)
MKITQCIDCYKDFEQPDNGSRRICDVCRPKHKQNHDRDYSFNRKHRKRAASTEAAAPPVISIADFNQQAREQRLSYGQLAARLREKA